MRRTELERYADAIVCGAVALGGGDTLVVQANNAHRELVVALAEAAYRAGAVAVDALYDDARLLAAKIREGPDDALGHRTPWTSARARALTRERTALVRIMGEFEQDVVGSLPADRLALDAQRGTIRTPWFTKAVRDGRFRGAIVVWPTPEWAARVFPNVGADKAQRRLARDCSGSAGSDRRTRPATRAGRSTSHR
jgi:aminopeptidase